ncbi:MAG: superinfection immunity protein [Terracidiphilus sp.]
MQSYWSLVLWYLIRVFATLVYFFPAIAASRYRHPRQLLIMCLNILLGWTVVGWVILLRWAIQASKQTGSEPHS